MNQTIDFVLRPTFDPLEIGVTADDGLWVLVEWKRERTRMKLEEGIDKEKKRIKSCELTWKSATE